MKQLNHPLTNAELQPPEGWPFPCDTLRIQHTPEDGATPEQMRSYWLPTDEERNALAAGGAVSLLVCGNLHPPVQLVVHHKDWSTVIDLTFQLRVAPWMQDCFGPIISADKRERNFRFLEEALELVQACGCTRDEALKLVDYVFSRPVGERGQEVGGTMVTLAALCLAQKLDMHDEGERELARISQPEVMTRIRQKQAGKRDVMGPLP